MTKSLTTNKWTSVPPVSTLEMMRRPNTANTDQWRGYRASLEATGQLHWVSIHVVLPRRTTGSHAEKTNKKKPYLSAVLLALLVRWYVTKCIDQRRVFRAIREATGCRHRVSMAANICHPVFFFEFFHRQTRWKRGLGDVKAPNNNRGMTYQSNGKE